MVNQIQEWKEELEHVQAEMAKINKFGLGVGDNLDYLFEKEQELLGLLWHFGASQD